MNKLIDHLISPFSKRFNSFMETRNPRERTLIKSLFIITFILLIALPPYMIENVLLDIDSENIKLQNALKKILEKKESVLSQQRKHKAIQRFYSKKIPPLASFLEKQATKEGLSLKEVAEEPQKIVDQYRRHKIRAKLFSVHLRPFIKMLESIENSSLPLTIDYLQIDHFFNGDIYNVNLGIVGYEIIKNKKTEKK